VKYLAEPYFRSLRSVSLGQDDPVVAIVDMAAQLRARGIDLLVLPVPGKPSIYPDRLWARLASDANVSGNTTTFRQELERQGIQTLDMQRVLSEARVAHPSPELYMKTDTHWSGTGVRIAAEAIAEHLRTVARVRDSVPPRPRYGRRLMLIERRGDIIEMTKLLAATTCSPLRRFRSTKSTTSAPARSTRTIRTHRSYGWATASHESLAPMILAGQGLSPTWRSLYSNP